jgi:hypothetical protein
MQTEDDETEIYELAEDDVESYDDVEEEEEGEEEEEEGGEDDYEKGEVLLHPAAVSQKRGKYVKSIIFDALCSAVGSAADQKRLFMMYHEVERGPFLLAYRYNQIFRFVMSLNTK